MTGYTHRINLFRNVDGLGWMFQSYQTTRDAIPTHVRSLYHQQANGFVRNIEVIKLK